MLFRFFINLKRLWKLFSFFLVYSSLPSSRLSFVLLHFENFRHAPSAKAQMTLVRELESFSFSNRLLRSDRFSSKLNGLSSFSIHILIVAVLPLLLLQLLLLFASRSSYFSQRHLVFVALLPRDDKFSSQLKPEFSCDELVCLVLIATCRLPVCEKFTIRKFHSVAPRRTILVFLWKKRIP